tara:strand:+ start:34229 stop:34573 length:345 start_codon:yes stop_codon:yes gene_type:complete
MKNNNKLKFFIFFIFSALILYIDYPQLITYSSVQTKDNYKVIHIPENFFNNEYFIDLSKYNDISIYNKSNLIQYQDKSFLMICPKKLKKTRCNKHIIVDISKFPSALKYYFEKG